MYANFVQNRWRKRKSGKRKSERQLGGESSTSRFPYLEGGEDPGLGCILVELRVEAWRVGRRLLVPRLRKKSPQSLGPNVAYPGCASRLGR